jgi:hypothetical protein
MIADPILGNTAERVVEQLNSAFTIFVNVFLAHFAKQPVVLVRQKRVIELNEKSGIDNGPIFFSERIR